MYDWKTVLFRYYLKSMICNIYGIATGVFLLPTIAGLLGKNVILPTIYWLLLTLLLVFLGGFKTYLDLFREHVPPPLSIKEVGKHAQLETREWADVSGGDQTNSLFDTYIMFEVAFLLQNNGNLDRTVAISLAFLESEWQQREGPFEFKCNNLSSQNCIFQIGSGEQQRIKVDFHYSFNLPKGSNFAASLAMLTKLVVNICLQEIGGEQIVHPVEFEVSTLHEEIDQEFQRLIKRGHHELELLHNDYLARRSEYESAIVPERKRFGWLGW